MTKLNSYVNFPIGTTESAFNFYKSVFGGEFQGGIMRFKDVPDFPGKEQMSAEQSNGVMHVALQIGNDMLMGSDAMEGMGPSVTAGNNIQLSLHPDSKQEADRLYAALSEGGTQIMPMMDMFWGDYWGTFVDKFGITWMVNYHKA
ncbi:MAG: VOC family protein [Bacteroidota bacterium]